jgi:hypothetical protein
LHRRLVIEAKRVDVRLPRTLVERGRITGAKEALRLRDSLASKRSSLRGALFEPKANRSIVRHLLEAKNLVGGLDVSRAREVLSRLRDTLE